MSPRRRMKRKSPPRVMSKRRRKSPPRVMSPRRRMKSPRRMVMSPGRKR